MQVRRRPLPLIAVGVLAVLAPLLGGAPASASPGPTAQEPRGLHWRDCPTAAAPELRCATLKVPLDYRNPGGRKIDVEISRIPATDPALRRGVLLFNPGGPGGPGLDIPGMARGLLPKAVLDRYDLIGFDPRGIGRSTPVVCGLTPDEAGIERPYKKETFARDTALARSFAEKCRARFGAGLKHFNTRNTARDMDSIRAALGERKLNYFGISYGTYLGAVYTQLFPDRSDRILLDSAVDPARVWQEDFRLWAPETEKAFHRWTRWAAERDARYGLGRTPEAVAGTFWELVRRAERQPIEAEGRRYDGDTIRNSMRASFFIRAKASEYLVVLKEAAAGKPVTGAPPVHPIPEDFASALWTVTCGDADWPTDPASYARRAARDKVRYPVFGDYASNITPCAFWDRVAEPTTKVDNRVGALILHNEWDSQTPLPDATGLRKAMKGARLVLVDEGEGHVVYGTGGSSCAERHADTYLVTGRLPARDTLCRPDPGVAENPDRRIEPPILTPRTARG
ncbi:alpha/beta fold hydrolase [Streptomyces sp. NPDC006798]|uniref:alpha/beta fold hydrolase n=1 Tax=Streptomyces sp. NPDC006798 TaxID=3155462 RepID=UPI00340C9BF4